jgi:tetratricopeptide (TPR) repeat protein
MIDPAPQFRPADVTRAAGLGRVRRSVLILLGASAVFVTVLMLPRREQTAPQSASGAGRRETADTPLAAASAPSAYVGPEACAPCHAERVREFQSTRHSQACTRPDPDRMPAGFGPGRGTYQTRVPGLHFEMTRSDSDFLVTSVRQTTDGEERWTSRIALVYGDGAGTDEVYFAWMGDQLRELPVVWLHHENQWANSMFNPYADRDFGREVTPQCLECHCTQVDRVPGAMSHYRADSLIVGVTCESCHGPGRRHVEFHQTHADVRDPVEIVNPGTLSRERQLDVCGHCHTNTIRYRRPPGSFRPGDKLDDFYRVHVTHRPEDDHVANQLQYLRQSRCFEGSDTLTCTTCHDPHRPRPPSEARSQACVECHGADSCTDRPAQPVAVRDKCIACHMPAWKKIQVCFHTADDVFVSPVLRWEHRIGVYPEARQQVLLDWYRTQSDDDSRATAVRLTEELAGYWRRRGAQFQIEHRLLAAADAYRRSLELQPDDETRSALEQVKAAKLQVNSRSQDAEALVRQNRVPEAITALETALTLDPNLALEHGKLGKLYAMVGNRELAVQHLEQVARCDPDEPYGEGMLGWLAYLDGRHEQALQHLRRADELEPYSAQVKYEIGLVLLKLNRSVEACDWFRTSLEISPQHVGGHQGLAHALLAAGRPAEALPCARRAAELTQGQNLDVLITLADVAHAAQSGPEADDALRRAINLASRTKPELLPPLRQKQQQWQQRPPP